MSRHPNDHQLRRMAIGLIALVMLYHAEKATAAVISEFAAYHSLGEILHHFFHELDDKAELGLVVLMIFAVGGWIGGAGLSITWIKSFFCTARRRRGTNSTDKPTFFVRIMRAIEAFFRSGIL